MTSKIYFNNKGLEILAKSKIQRTQIRTKSLPAMILSSSKPTRPFNISGQFQRLKIKLICLQNTTLNTIIVIQKIILFYILFYKLMGISVHCVELAKCLGLNGQFWLIFVNFEKASKFRRQDKVRSGLVAHWKNVIEKSRKISSNLPWSECACAISRRCDYN